MNTNTLVSILRLVHVFAGVFWAGTTFAFFFIIGPTIRATGPAGRQFAAHLITKAHFTAIMSSAAGLTILAGALLYLIDSSWFTSAWMSSGAGVGFAIGGIAGLIAFISGSLFGRANTKMVELGSQIQGPPTAEQQAALQATQSRLGLYGWITVVSMIIAVALMAAARYLRF
jgi:uncharacterized membrane protein